MTQIGRPDSDISLGSWSPYPTDPTTLFDKIDEETPNDDVDYIHSDLDEDVCEVGVGDVTDPGVGTDHIIRCYAKSPNGGGAKEKLDIALVENGIVRSQGVQTIVSRTAYGLIEHVIPEAEANAIQNYANLRIRFHICVVNSNEPIQVTQADFRCPDAATEFVYAGDVPLTVLPDEPKGMLSKSYAGDIPLSALPSYVSILDRIYAGDIPLAVLSDAPVAPLEKSYGGDIPLSAMPDFPKAILEKSYAGAVALALVPNSTYGLFGANEFVYAGDIPLTALPSYSSILDRVYQGAIPLVLTPNSIYSLVEILQEFVYGGDISLFILPGYSSMLEKTYEGDIPVLLTPSSLCLLEEQVDVFLRAKRPGMIYTRKPSSFYSKTPRSATTKSMRKG